MDDSILVKTEGLYEEKFYPDIEFNSGICLCWRGALCKQPLRLRKKLQ